MGFRRRRVFSTRPRFSDADEFSRRLTRTRFLDAAPRFSDAPSFLDAAENPRFSDARTSFSTIDAAGGRVFLISDFCFSISDVCGDRLGSCAIVRTADGAFSPSVNRTVRLSYTDLHTRVTATL